MSGKRSSRTLPLRLECEHVLPIAAEADVHDLSQRLVHLLVRFGGAEREGRGRAKHHKSRKRGEGGERANTPETHERAAC